MIPVFVLAGGKGERFKPYTEVIPKCLIPVAGKPCVRHIIDALIEQRFDNITLCINQKDEAVFLHEFRDVPRDVMKLSVSAGPLGTAGEVHDVWGVHEQEEGFMVIYGDDLTFRDYRAFYEYHKSIKRMTTREHLTFGGSVVLTDNVIVPFGVVSRDVDSRVVTSFNEKPHQALTIWVGVAIFELVTQKYLSYRCDFAEDVIPKMIIDGEDFYGYLVHDRWVDVGNLDHWKTTNKYLRNAL